MLARRAPKNRTLIAVPVTAQSTQEALKDIKTASRLADVIELRLDCIHHPELEKLLKKKPRPIIATNRPMRQGGKFDGFEEERMEILKKAVALGADYVDVENDSLELFGSKKNKTKLIFSYHNFEETPEDLEDIHKELLASGADIVKIATFARDITDNIKVFNLLQKAQEPTIALCMGELGLISRVLAAKFGSFLSFASLDKGKESAPGQIPARELIELYNFRQIDKDTKIFGLIGNPVGHSMSPAVHNAAFKKLGLNCVYLPFKVDNLEEFVKAFKELDVQGYSVTIPHKEAVTALLDEVEPIARKIGAVNCIVNKNGRLVGYNTDWTGAIKALEDILKGEEPLHGKKITLVGAGGAARAIAFGLKERGACLTIVNRTKSRGEELAREVGCYSRDFDDLRSIDTEILINSTPVGMHPKINDIPVPENVIKRGILVFDIVYNPLETRLLREARLRGCNTLDGMSMFVNQAAEQFKLWTGLKAPVKLMEKVVKARLKTG